MTERAEFFLGIIAFATAAVAVGQLCVVVVTSIAARRIARLAQTVEDELKPIFGHLNSIGRDASRAAALASAQVERADRLFGDISMRVEDAMNNVQASIEQPAREGRARARGVSRRLPGDSGNAPKPRPASARRRRRAVYLKPLLAGGRRCTKCPSVPWGGTMPRAVCRSLCRPRSRTFIRTGSVGSGIEIRSACQTADCRARRGEDG